MGYVHIQEIDRGLDQIDTYRIYVSRAYNAGDDYPHQIIGKPILGSCCTETYVSIGPFLDKTAASNALSYMTTKFFRFMVSIIRRLDKAL